MRLKAEASARAILQRALRQSQRVTPNTGQATSCSTKWNRVPVSDYPLSVRSDSRMVSSFKFQAAGQSVAQAPCNTGGWLQDQIQIGRRTWGALDRSILGPERESLRKLRNRRVKQLSVVLTFEPLVKTMKYRHGCTVLWTASEEGRMYRTMRLPPPTVRTAVSQRSIPTAVKMLALS